MKEGDRITSINNFLSKYPAFKKVISVIENEISDIDNELGNIAADFNGVLDDGDALRVEKLIASKAELSDAWDYYNELIDIIRYILDSIKNSRLRSAARLHFLDGMTWSSAAEVVGYSAGDVNDIEQEITMLVKKTARDLSSE